MSDKSGIYLLPAHVLGDSLTLKTGNRIYTCGNVLNAYVNPPYFIKTVKLYVACDFLRCNYIEIFIHLIICLSGIETWVTVCMCVCMCVRVCVCMYGCIVVWLSINVIHNNCPVLCTCTTSHDTLPCHIILTLGQLVMLATSEWLNWGWIQ